MIGTATLEQALSRAEIVSPAATLWQGAIDPEGALLDLHDVSFHRGRLVLHGVQAADVPALRRVLQPYVHFVQDVMIRDRFDDVFELSPDPLRWSECDRVEERCAFFLSPWHIDNAYHLHANNLLPVFANLLHAGLLEAPRVLYLHEGDAARNAQAVQLWTLMSALFDGAVEPLAPLRASPGRVGFRRIRWGRGPLLLYLRDVRETEFHGTADAYRNWALRHLDVPMRRAPSDPEARPRLLYLERSGARRIERPELLIESFGALGHELRLFDGWRDAGAHGVAGLIHGSDVLIGVHGAALANMAYLPRGSMVVELLVGSPNDGRVFPHMSHHFGHRHVRIDVPGESGPQGRAISRIDADHIARRVLTEWQRRQEARTITVRDLGTGNWGNEAFWYMFGRSYARRYGLELRVGPWAGNRLIGACDPPLQESLPDVVEKTEHGVFDTIIPHDLPRGDVNFVGYFQYHTSYYRHDREYLQALFRPHPEMAARIEPYWRALRDRGRVAVALHIRRRDYGFGYFYRAPTVWYLELLDRLWPRLESPFLYVATDEPETVLPDFARYHPASAADLGPPLPAHDFYRDFYVLQHSDVLAISNSTFSFAAAMLNTGLQQAYRPHLPTRRMIPFDPWDDKPLQQESEFRVERYPSLPEVWRPTPSWKRYALWARHHARTLRDWGVDWAGRAHPNRLRFWALDARQSVREARVRYQSGSRRV